MHLSVCVCHMIHDREDIKEFFSVHGSLKWLVKNRFFKLKIEYSKSYNYI